MVELHPAHEQFAYRIELFGDEIDKLEHLHVLGGDVVTVSALAAGCETTG